MRKKISMVVSDFSASEVAILEREFLIATQEVVETKMMEASLDKR